MTRREDYPPPVVLDTTVLSCVASSEDLHLLETLPIRFVTVEAVIEELRTGDEADTIHHHWVTEEGFRSLVSSIADALNRLD